MRPRMPPKRPESRRETRLGLGPNEASQIADAAHVLHAFQKKSKSGIATPQPNVDWVEKRLKAILARYGLGRGVTMDSTLDDTDLLPVEGPASICVDLPHRSSLRSSLQPNHRNCADSPTWGCAPGWTSKDVKDRLDALNVLRHAHDRSVLLGGTHATIDRGGGDRP